jgi:V8-like Glu-specific endopeptidase
MSTTYAGYAQEYTDTETNDRAANEAMAPEAAPDSGSEFSETGEEGAPEDRLAHERMSNSGAASEGRSQDEGGLDSESALMEAGEESDFETDTEWTPESRFPESSAEEAVVDAYFAESSTTTSEAQELVPIFAAMLPVLKAAIPVLVSALASKGAQAATRAVAGAAQRAGSAAVQGAVRAAAPKAGQAVAQVQGAARLLLGNSQVPPQLKALLQQLLARKEFAEESAAMDGGTEADVDTLNRALQISEVVLGVDDRRRVTPTTAAPWNRLCHLSILAANGQRYLGTGFFVNKRTVITAGHCVYPTAAGWARQITVTQARDGTSTPYGSVTSSALRTVRGWAVNRRREYDYGAIILPRSYTQRVSSFAFAARSDAELRGRKLNLAGYPGDKPSGTVWYHGRVATGVTPRVITYDIDTAGGQSGSPVWTRSGNTRTVVGIHTNGAQSGNSATRITQAVFANLMAWRQEGE